MRQRGSITFWINEAAVSGWLAPRRTTPGGQSRYSDLAIETALICGIVFDQPLRQTEGLMTSLFRLLRVDLPVPDHTTLSRRCPTLSLCRTARHNEVKAGSGPIHVLIDSTGLKIYGAGQWLEDKYGVKAPDNGANCILLWMPTLAKSLQRFSPIKTQATSASLQHCLSRLLSPSPVSQQMEPMTVTGHTKPCGAIALVPVLSFHRACGNLRTHIMAHRISVTGIVMLSQNMAG